MARSRSGWQLCCMCTIALFLHAASHNLEESNAPIFAAYMLPADGGSNQDTTPAEQAAVVAPVLFSASGESSTAAQHPASYDAAVGAEQQKWQPHAAVATEAVPGQTHLGLALPGKLRWGELSGAYDDQDETPVDYTYLEDDQTSDAEAWQVEAWPEHPWGTPKDQPAAEEAAELAGRDSSSDLVLMSRLPLGIILGQGLAQPVTSMASNIARTVWEAVQQVEAAATQQLRLANPFQLQWLQVVVEDGNSRSSSSITAPAGVMRSLATGSSSSSSSGSQLDADTMEVSVTVESHRPRPWFPFFQSTAQKKVLEDTMDAAAIATAVFQALGPNVGEQLQQQKPSEEMQHMVKELKETGSYTDGLPSNREQLSATAAAAVAAAASTLTAEDPWNLEMEVEVTRTVHSNCGSWLSIALIVAAAVVTHIGLFMLIAPWIAKLVGCEDFEDEEDDKLQQQFISAGLAEAGLYQKLLPKE